ncbi:hypothetical protein BJ166DRAFT_277299 [Pestalotiopsis sp. NC0098]|nr:hypothetical protein BJ166DRAFT_277299 [Pestalotiopsis sp. NC0098]
MPIISSRECPQFIGADTTGRCNLPSTYCVNWLRLRFQTLRLGQLFQTSGDPVDRKCYPGGAPFSVHDLPSSPPCHELLPNLSAWHLVGGLDARWPRAPPNPASRVHRGLYPSWGSVALRHRPERIIRRLEGLSVCTYGEACRQLGSSWSGWPLILLCCAVPQGRHGIVPWGNKPFPTCLQQATSRTSRRIISRRRCALFEPLCPGCCIHHLSDRTSMAVVARPPLLFRWV